MTRTEIVLGTFVCLLFNQLTWLIAKENFVVLRLWFAAIWCHVVVPKEKGSRFPKVPACICPSTWSRIPEDLNCESVPHLFHQMHISGCSWVSFLLGLLRFFIVLIIPATLWSTHSLTETSTGWYILEGKGSQCVGLAALPPACACSTELMEASTSWNPKGFSRPVRE